MSPTEIGILGTGDVGRTLGSGFIARGHDVKLGDRLLGWRAEPPLDTGGIEGARLLEPMCILWVNYGVRTGNWAGHAFKLLRVE